MKYAALLTLIAALLLVACGGSEDEETPADESQDTFIPVVPNADSDDDQPESPDLPSDYPAPATVASGYPEPAVPTATPDPYPGGKLIMIRPMGEQCAAASDYENAGEAVDELEIQGIKVLEFEEVDLIVCSSCGCPTSEHIRVTLDPADLAQAQSLGWRRE
jgi:hypothetical protein